MSWSDLVFNIEWFVVASITVMEIETGYGAYWSGLDRPGFYTIIGSFVWSSMVILRALLGEA